MDSISIAGWSNFFSVQAEVAATLTGLVFVAVSLNLSRILAVPGLIGRAGESLLDLFGVVLISTCALIPDQPNVALGIEIVALSALNWLVQSNSQVRYLRANTGHPRFWGITRICQTQFALVPFLGAGILLMTGSPGAPFCLAAGCVFSLFAGVANAWVLLVEILR